MFEIFNKILEYVPIIGSDTKYLAEISSTITSEGSTSNSSSDNETVIAHSEQVTPDDKYFTKTGNNFHFIHTITNLIMKSNFRSHYPSERRTWIH